MEKIEKNSEELEISGGVCVSNTDSQGYYGTQKQQEKIFEECNNTDLQGRRPEFGR